MRAVKNEWRSGVMAHGVCKAARVVIEIMAQAVPHMVCGREKGQRERVIRSMEGDEEGLGGVIELHRIVHGRIVRADTALGRVLEMECNRNVDCR